MAELEPDSSLPYEYALCSWRVASVVPLPDLPPWTGDDRAPDVTLVIGDVPPMADAVLTTPLVQIDAAGNARFGVDAVADYRIDGGSRITIAPRGDPDSADVRLFLLGSGLGFLCHQRGVLPLHAASVEVDGMAVAFGGSSGSGKSTLADAFARRGHRVLSDDVSPVDLTAAVPRVLPSLRRIRMWADSLANAGWDQAETERCREGLDKFSRSLHAAMPVDPLPPRAIFHLRDQSRPRTRAHITRLRGADAAYEFRRQVYRWRSLTGMIGVPAAMARCAHAAAAFPHHFVIERPFDYAKLDDIVDDILAVLRSPE